MGAGNGQVLLLRLVLSDKIRNGVKSLLDREMVSPRQLNVRGHVSQYLKGLFRVHKVSSLTLNPVIHKGSTMVVGQGDDGVDGRHGSVKLGGTDEAVPTAGRGP